MTAILVAMGKSDFENMFDHETKERLYSIGHVVERFDLTDTSNDSEYASALAQYAPQIVLTAWNSPLLTEKIYRNLKLPKYLCHLCGSIKKYVERGVILAGLLVTNWGNSAALPVAEHAVMMILSCLRQLPYYQIEICVNRGWRGSRPDTRSLIGRSVGLYGFGAVAGALVKLLTPYQCRISAFDPWIPIETVTARGVQSCASLSQLFAQSEIVSIHAGLTSTTHHSVDRQILGLLQDNGILINTARGGIINTRDLVAELETGRILAGLDVFETEPLPADSPLRDLTNCLLTPHLGGPTPDRRRDLGKTAVDNLLRYVQGETVRFRITKELYDRLT